MSFVLARNIYATAALPVRDLPDLELAADAGNRLRLLDGADAAVDGLSFAADETAELAGLAEIARARIAAIDARLGADAHAIVTDAALVARYDVLVAHHRVVHGAGAEPPVVHDPGGADDLVTGRARPLAPDAARPATTATFRHAIGVFGARAARALHADPTLGCTIVDTTCTDGTATTGAARPDGPRGLRDLARWVVHHHGMVRVSVDRGRALWVGPLPANAYAYADAIAQRDSRPDLVTGDHDPRVPDLAALAGAVRSGLHLTDALTLARRLTPTPAP